MFGVTVHRDILETGPGTKSPGPRMDTNKTRIQKERAEDRRLRIVKTNNKETKMENIARFQASVFR
jgi:hypothetical protein